MNYLDADALAPCLTRLSESHVIDYEEKLVLANYFHKGGFQLLASSWCWELHDDFIKWKLFPCNWPSVKGIHWSPVDSPHKGQWCRALMFSLICTWTNKWFIKQSRHHWFEKPSHSLWCLCDGQKMQVFYASLKKFSQTRINFLPIPLQTPLI